MGAWITKYYKREQAGKNWKMAQGPEEIIREQEEKPKGSREQRKIKRRNEIAKKE